MNRGTVQLSLKKETRKILLYSSEMFLDLCNKSPPQTHGALPAEPDLLGPDAGSDGAAGADAPWFTVKRQWPVRICYALPHSHPVFFFVVLHGSPSPSAPPASTCP